MSAPEAGLIALTLVACVCAVLHVILLGFVIYIMRRVPPASVGLSLPEPEGGWPTVCVVVPAHNESDVIETLARSLLAQHYERLRVVFVLDRCTDDTEEKLRRTITDDTRFEIVVIDTCQEGWSGKSHAAWRGVTDSVGARNAQMLLFTDADTIFHPHCVRASVALLEHRKLGMLSLLSTLTHSRWFERVAQPVASTELMRQNRLDRVNAPGNPKPFANGQFMLFARDAYERIGGHESVKDALLEDIRFAHELKNSKIQFGVHRADSILRCSMYRDWPTFCRGWKRIFTEATGHRAWYLSRAGLKLLGSGVALPLCALVALPVGLAGEGVLSLLCAIAGGAGVASWYVALGAIWRSQGAPLWSVPAAPVGAMLISGLLRGAARDLRQRKGITWAGMTYQRPVHTSKRRD
ncbi:MAG: glycosyltransferase family 2 protein [Planctomycetota bacterium]|jgi:chlorobactene glucosyltransferase